MLTRKAKYGLKALLYMASHASADRIRLGEVVEAQSIPHKFLHAIMLELRNGGFVVSKKGPGGGYALAEAALNAKVGDIIRVLDGPLAPIACASRNNYIPCTDCKDVERCRVRLAMLKVRDAIAVVLDGMTLRDMAALTPGPSELLPYLSDRVDFALPA
jgi:Rrf2 family protein